MAAAISSPTAATTPVRAYLGLVVALLPFLLSLVVQWRPPQPLVVTPPVRPSLAFRQYMIDLGKPPTPTDLSAWFVFENRGQHPVTMTDVQTSCGCMKPKLAKQTFLPGETGRLDLRVDAAGTTAGPKEYFVDVSYSDPEPRQTRLTMKLDMPEAKLTVIPRALVVYPAADENDDTLHVVKVSDVRGREFRITRHELNSPWVTVEPQTARRDEAGAWIQELKLVVSGNVPAGRHEAILDLSFDDPDVKRYRMPIRILRKEQTPSTVDAASP